MIETPEQVLIRNICEMQKHWFEVLTSDRKEHTQESAMFLLYAKNQYTLLTELINIYDDSKSEKEQICQ